jgi:predicted phosphodiesterase
VRVPQAKPRRLDGWKTALLLPDPQFGFRRDIYTGELDPFHDERALDIALQIAEIERPDLTIWLGDVLDLASAGKYQQEAGFALTTQPALDAAHLRLAQFCALSDETRYIEGNHDIRLQNLIIDNAKTAFGLRKANAVPEEWPVLSVPNLLRFDELGIKYIGGYPAGATYINDNLAAIHGSKIGNNIRSSASMVVEDERVSVITGHVHHIETRYKTRNTRGKPKFTFAHTPGCLCRIDGAVPSTKGGTDPFGRPVKSWEDWQQGVAIVRYQEGDGKFALETVPIFEGWAVHQGKELTAR